MLTRIQEYLSELYPLDISRVVKEVNIGFDHEISPYYTLIPFLIEIALLKLKGHQFKPTGDFILDHLLIKLNKVSSGNLSSEENRVDHIDLDKKKNLQKLCKFIFYACIVAPIGEEFFFRGVLTPVFKNGLSYLGMNESIAPIMSSVLFGLAHPFPKKMSMIPFGYLMENINENNQGSLWSSTSFHFKNNVICTFTPLLILAICYMTLVTLKYLLEHGINLEKELSKKSDFTSKTILGAIHGSLWSLFALPHVFLADKFFPTFPCELSLSTKMAGTVALGAISGAINSGLHFFSGLKNKIPSQHYNDTRTLDSNNLRNNK